MSSVVGIEETCVCLLITFKQSVNNSINNWLESTIFWLDISFEQMWLNNVCHCSKTDSAAK